MTFHVDLAGEETIEVTALGPGDAEHQLEKIVSQRCPEARIEMIEIRRSGADPRLVEHFRVHCRVRVALVVRAESRLAARRAALRHMRERFEGTGLWSMEWEEPKLREGDHPDLPHRQHPIVEI